MPLLSYSALVVAALLVMGIHNTWDNVTYIALELTQPQNQRQDE